MSRMVFFYVFIGLLVIFVWSVFAGFEFFSEIACNQLLITDVGGDGSILLKEGNITCSAIAIYGEQANTFLDGDKITITDKKGKGGALIGFREEGDLVLMLSPEGFGDKANELIIMFQEDNVVIGMETKSGRTKEIFPRP